MSEDPAQARFFIISILRLLGVAAVILGILIARGAIGWPAPLGYALLVVGLVDVFVVPQVLARRWRTPKE